MAAEEPKHRALSVGFNIFSRVVSQLHLAGFFFFCKGADNPTDFRNNELSSVRLYMKTTEQRQVLSL